MGRFLTWVGHEVFIKVTVLGSLGACFALDHDHIFAAVQERYNCMLIFLNANINQVSIFMTNVSEGDLLNNKRQSDKSMGRIEYM